jgi:hypothetical protein
MTQSGHLAARRLPQRAAKGDTTREFYASVLPLWPIVYDADISLRLWGAGERSAKKPRARASQPDGILQRNDEQGAGSLLAAPPNFEMFDAIVEQ